MVTDRGFHGLTISILTTYALTKKTSSYLIKTRTHRKTRAFKNNSRFIVKN